MTVTKGPKELELERRLDRMYAEGLKNINFFWGDDAAKLPKEELCAHILEWFEHGDRWHKLSDEEKMRAQIKEAYKYLQDVSHAGSFSADEWMRLLEADQDLMKRISTMRNAMEQARMVLGNWVRNERSLDVKEDNFDFSIRYSVGTSDGSEGDDTPSGD